MNSSQDNQIDLFFSSLATTHLFLKRIDFSEVGLKTKTRLLNCYKSLTTDLIHSLGTHSNDFLDSALSSTILQNNVPEIRCNFCLEVFDSVSYLQIHIERTHPKLIKYLNHFVIPKDIGTDNFYCLPCKIKVIAPEKHVKRKLHQDNFYFFLLTHDILKNNSDDYICKLCDVVVNFCDIAAHIKENGHTQKSEEYLASVSLYDQKILRSKKGKAKCQACHCKLNYKNIRKHICKLPHMRKLVNWSHNSIIMLNNENVECKACDFQTMKALDVFNHCRKAAHIENLTRFLEKSTTVKKKNSMSCNICKVGSIFDISKHVNNVNHLTNVAQCNLRFQDLDWGKNTLYEISNSSTGCEACNCRGISNMNDILNHIDKTTHKRNLEIFGIEGESEEDETEIDWFFHTLQIENDSSVSCSACLVKNIQYKDIHFHINKSKHLRALASK